METWNQPFFVQGHEFEQFLTKMEGHLFPMHYGVPSMIRNFRFLPACASLALGLVSFTSLVAQENIPEAVAIEEKLPVAGVADKADGKGEGKLRPLTVNVELSSQASIAGTLTDVSQVPMKTAFGEASIPMSEIAGIRFASGQDNTTTVVMLNGDSITGAVDLKVLNVETEWGSAKINGSAIQSILFVPDLKWVNNNGLNGRRWFLIEASKPLTSETAKPTVNGSNGLNTVGNPSSLPSGNVLPTPSTGIPNRLPSGSLPSNPTFQPRPN